MAKQPMTDAKTIMAFLFAKNAIFTLRNVASGNHLTFQITEMENKDPKDKRPPLFSVGLLKGPDNLTDYTYIGIIINRKTFKTTGASKLTMDSAPCKAIAKCLEAYVAGRIHTAIEFWPSNHCSKCGRLLNDDASLEIGLGPDCAEALGVPHGGRVAGQAHPAQAAAVASQVVPPPSKPAPVALTKAKLVAMKQFRDRTDGVGDAKFLALSDEAGFTVEDWRLFSEREAQEQQVAQFKQKVAQKFKTPPPASAYEGVNNGFRSKSEEPSEYAPADISAMVELQKTTDPDKYNSIKVEGMTDDQVKQFWYRRFESIPLANFRR